METLQPKLRFPEFKGDWNINSFKDLVKISQGLQINISERLTEQEEGSLFYITNEFLREKSDKKYFIKNASKSVICNKDDILMTRTGNTGKVVTNVEGAFHNNFFKISYPNNIDKDFLVNFLNLYQTQNFILRLAGTSTIPDLNHSDFYKIEFLYPSFSEQTKIASFLTSIDAKINQLTQKKSLLEEYKKGIMQKIFRQELRFKDDNGKEFEDWEERKLQEVGEFKNGINKSKKDFGFGVPFINLMDVFGKSTILDLNLDLVNANDKELKLYELKKGDVLFIRSSVKKSGVGETSVVLSDLKDTVYSGFLIRFRDNKIKLDLNFKKYCFSNKKFREDLISLSSTSANTNINQESLNDLKINIPSLEEQIKIANFLSAIDVKINKVSTQLEQTTQYKRGLLQQMFV